MRRSITTVLLLFLALNTGWFVVYSAQLGWQGLAADTPGFVSRVFSGADPFSTVAIAVHMVAGGVLTLAAPLQALPFLRRRFPTVHRWSGRVIVALAMATAVGGLIYIGTHGTIGGWWMSLWFAVYGLAMGWSAWQTFQFARVRQFDEHFAWATRLVILAVGSWIYRMHYALWYMMTDGAGSQPDFTGPFDLVQVVAFFIPYLLIAEVLLRRMQKKKGA